MLEQFILGEGKAPEWFDNEANAGRIKMIYNEDEELIGAQILSGTKTYEAKVGDSIINTKYGVAVIPQEKAKAYGVQRKDAKDSKQDKKEAEESND